ncbi:MAG: hypothetical protein K2N91_05155, partial [Muribaculaceae bacterium]|nr:hypothetical protein [Muribaculaceae bacterium]
MIFRHTVLISLIVLSLLAPTDATARNKGKKQLFKIESLTLPTTITTVSATDAADQMSLLADMVSDSILCRALRSAVTSSWAGVTRYTPTTYLAELREIALSFPEIASLDTIGFSVEGRPIATLRLGSGPHTLYVMGALHGREWLSTTQVMKSIEHIARGWNCATEYEGFNVAQMLDSCTIYFSPMFNPDGVDISQRGAAGRDSLFRSIPITKSKVGYPSWKAN